MNETKKPEDGFITTSTLPESVSEAEKAIESPDQYPVEAAPAPDGGLQAWSVVLGAWCTSFVTFGWLNSIGVFQEYYQKVFVNESPSTVSWIPSLQIFLMLGGGPIVGIIYDNYGPRLLLLVGTILHVFGVMMASLGKTYYQVLLAQGVCSAIGAGMIFQPTLSCLQGWFSKKAGAVNGIVFTGSSIGGIILPIMTEQLIRKAGFGWAMRACGFIILFLMIIAILLVRPFKTPTPQKVTLKQLIQPFKELDFILLAIASFLLPYGYYGPLDYVQVLGLKGGMSPALAQYLVPILNAGSFFGRLFFGVLSDKLGKANVFITVCYTSGLWILALWLPSSGTAATIAFAVLFGFTSAAYVSLIAPVTMLITPVREAGFRLGILFFTSAIGGLTSSPVQGAILAGSGGGSGVKIFSGVLFIVATTFVLVLRVRRVGWKWNKRW